MWCAYNHFQIKIVQSGPGVCKVLSNISSCLCDHIETETRLIFATYMQILLKTISPCIAVHYFITMRSLYRLCAM